MPYGIILLLGSIALVFVFVSKTNAPGWSKILVAGLLAVALANFFGYLHLGLPGLFFHMSLCICISLYLACWKARF